MKCLGYILPEAKVIDQRRFLKDVEGSGHGLMEIISPHLPRTGRPQKSSTRMACNPTGTGTEHVEHYR
jgi:hypothetical protein